MKKSIFRARSIIAILVGIFLVFIILLRLEIIGHPILNMSFRYSDKRIARQFKDAARKPAIRYHHFNDRALRCLELITDPDLPFVIFIHGAPGSSADYLNYFRDETLTSQVNLIAVDRPGYGGSKFGHAVTSIKKQGEAIQSIINKVNTGSATILVGHSYGGPIAIQMAIDNPDAYSKIILLAPALDPDHEKEIKVAQLAMIQPLRWLTPPALRVAADEKITHVEELRKMVPHYHRINTPVCHIHGDKDSLVPYENLSFSRININSNVLETITLPNVDHFLPWSHYDLIVNKILYSIPE